MKAKNVYNGEVIELKGNSIEDFEDEVGIEEIMLIGKGQTRRIIFEERE